MHAKLDRGKIRAMNGSASRMHLKCLASMGTLSIVSSHPIPKRLREEADPGYVQIPLGQAANQTTLIFDIITWSRIICTGMREALFATQLRRTWKQ
jgi:hypothetical protein